MTMSNNFLVNHAIDNVWCGPGQDKQHILAPTRISKSTGATYSILIGLSWYNLPSNGPKYDVFVFGDILPSVLGMDSRTNTWITAKAHCEAKSLMIHLYTQQGIQYPLTKAWFLYTRSGNLVIAVERINHFPNFAVTQLYVRWRSAAFFAAPVTPGNIGVKEGYLQFTGNDAAYATFRAEWIAHRDLPYGRAILLVNGRRVMTLAFNSLVIGDHLEWIFDGDIKEVIQIPYTDLLSFNSTLDGVNKFLLPRRRDDDQIDFVDDMDVYLLNYTKVAEYTGLYFHQNKVDALRMVTHKDYAINAQYVNSTATDNAWTLGANIRIEITTRYSGMDKHLIFEHHRIKELLKLPEEQRLDAMATDEAGVEVWTADSLESSMYLKLMAMRLSDITPARVMEAYGYNAVSRLTGFVPIKVTPGIGHVDLFYGQYTKSTVYEYDQDRKLIGWYPHEQSRQYPLHNADCRFVEAYAGTGGLGLSTVYNSHLAQDPYVLSADRNYRFYKGRVLTDGGFGDWEDVTNDETVYTLDGLNVLWTDLSVNAVTAIRNDRDFLSKDLELSSDDGILIFSVGVDEILPGRQSTYTLMDIPPGELDLFLNGHDLVPDIDYYCDWPEICIVSKKHWLVDEPTQKITIRARGFCNPDLSLNTDEENGFVIHGQLSRNGRYNVRDDKVTRISLAGKLYTFDEVGFAEDGTINPISANGLPYRITHPYIPLSPLVAGDTYSYRAASLVIDEAIEGYMDEYLPETVNSLPNPIFDRYTVVSPFISKVTEDILRGYITMDDFQGEYTQQDVADRLVGYSYLLEYDPVLRETRTELFNYHPFIHSTLALDLYQFKFIYTAIQVFLFGRIDLGRFATVRP